MDESRSLWTVIKSLLLRFEDAIDKENQRRTADGFERYRKIEILLLGQVSLLVRPDVANKLLPVSTGDIDAHLRGEFVPCALLKRLMREVGLSYDEQSEYIWVPEESTRTIIYESPTVRCEALDPIYTLLSKAIKAPEKNKNLVKQGIALYGEPLVTLITQYGGDPEYFIEE